MENHTATPRGCPALGFFGNPVNHASEPTTLHRCHVTAAPTRIEPDTQRALCLTTGFTACARYIGAFGPPEQVAGVGPQSLPHEWDQTQPRLPQLPQEAQAPTLTIESAPAPNIDGEVARADPAPVLVAAPLGAGLRAANNGASGRPSRTTEVAVALVGVLATTAMVGVAFTVSPTARSAFFSWAQDTVTDVPAPGAPAAAREATTASQEATVSSSLPVPSVAVATPGRLTSPTAPAELATGPVGAASLRPVLDDRFEAGSRRWPHAPQSTAWYADGGGYRLHARQAGQFVALAAPVTEALQDVVVTATFRKRGGPEGGGYGVIVRDQERGQRDGVGQAGRFYVFEVGDRGEAGVWRRDGDRWIDLLPWTRFGAVRLGGEPNELVVRAIGPQLTFLVNGTQVATLQDSALASGAVGVFAGGDLNEVAIERFLVQTPG